VAEHIGVRAASFSEGISQDRQMLEGTVRVNGLRHLEDATILPCQPGLIDGNGSEWVSKQVTPQRTLFPLVGEEDGILNGVPGVLPA
jgi:hypothetical protein